MDVVHILLHVSRLLILCDFHSLSNVVRKTIWPSQGPVHDCILHPWKASIPFRHKRARARNTACPLYILPVYINCDCTRHTSHPKNPQP
jgi:hypothetical protein